MRTPRHDTHEAPRLHAGEDRALLLGPGAEVICTAGRLRLAHPASQQQRVLLAGQGWRCEAGGVVQLHALQAATYQLTAYPVSTVPPQKADGPRAWARGPWQRWLAQLVRRVRSAA